MNKNIFSLTLLSLLIPGLLMAQPEQVDMADQLRENGKIYVVVTVLSIVFAGIIGYLILLDRKIGKMEKKMKQDS